MAAQAGLMASSELVRLAKQEMRKTASGIADDKDL
jgi:hypothetical protein